NNLKITFEQAGIGMVQFNADGNILQANPQFYKILRINSLNKIHNIWDVFQKDDERSENFLKVWNHKKEKGFFEQQLENDQKKIWVAFLFTLVSDSQRKPKYLFGILKEITESKESEANLKLARDQALEAGRAKDIFLMNMSHEIRTPLNGIMGFTEILLLNEEEKSKIEMLKSIDYSSKFLSEIIQDILDFSKIESGNIGFESQKINLRELILKIEDVIKNRNLSKNIDFIIEIQENIPLEVESDEIFLKKILMNLLSNAFKFTEKGFVKLSVLLVKRDHFYAEICFKIEDSGIGMNEKIQKKIFEEFYQGDLSLSKKYQGTGLGLSIARALIKKMKGAMSVQSEEGKGSVFMFVLPFNLFRNGENEGKEEKRERKGILENLKVLIVDDNDISRQIAGIILSQRNCSFSFSANGENCLSKLEEEKFDLILMDIQMPLMNGIEAVRKIREKNSKIKIIAYTAYFSAQERQKYLESGMNEVLIKPLKSFELFQKIESVFLSEF
ncbi:MAG TPA: hypothetical protein DHW82_08000, partial [Spirochaetia bacterium]|nr:hypothetical protein [Spirochaetia bacterium]